MIGFYDNLPGRAVSRGRCTSLEDRLAEVLRRSKKNFGPDVGAAIDALLSKTNLSILAGTLLLWGGSHLFGAGEIVDVLLLAVGAFTIGWSSAPLPHAAVRTSAIVSCEARNGRILTFGAPAVFEEALAETIAQLRVNGVVLEGLKFPVANGYMTISSLMSEGAAIGTITVGGTLFSVQFIPSVHDSQTRADACYVAPVCQ
jgi:hypothetical protein